MNAMKFKLRRRIKEQLNNSAPNNARSERLDRLVSSYEQDIIKILDAEYKLNTKPADRWADNVASFAGSWGFIISFCVFLVLWTTWNSLNVTRHWDPYPFILLNLVLSFIAAFQAPIIIMSQNRQAVRDKHEAIIDFAINYKAELEIDDIQRHLHSMEIRLKEIQQHLKGS
jgi:uncharacterized membrane protein